MFLLASGAPSATDLFVTIIVSKSLLLLWLQNAKQREKKTFSSSFQQNMKKVKNLKYLFTQRQ